MVTPWLSAQVAPVAPATKPAPANVVVTEKVLPLEEREDEEVLALSPFVVTAEKDNGYQATQTLAGTRLRTNLRDVGAAVSVVTSQFIADTGSTDAKDVLVYTAGTEASGPGGNFSGVSGGTFSNPEAGLQAPQQGTRVRGLSGADLTRDFFPTSIPLDSYNTERIDISRGANAILFGLGSPAGIINNQLKTPNLKKNGVTFQQTVSRYESHREVLDVNQVILKDRLSVRVIGLNDDEKFRQQPAFEHDQRLYAAMRYEPKLFKSGFTQMQVSYERGNVSANRPRPTPPHDGLSVWFDVLGKVAIDPTNTTAVTSNPLLAAHLGAAGRWFGQVGAVFLDPASSVQGGTGTPEFMMSRGGVPFTQWFGVGNYTTQGNNPNFFLNQQFAPAGQAYAGLWRYQEIRDPSVFNFYDILIDGPNKNEDSDFNAINAVLRQTFLNDAVGVEVAYDKQGSGRHNTSIIGFDAATIHVDMQSKLVNGAPNPNFGRPYFASDPLGNNIVDTDREAFRATAYATMDLTRKNGFLRHLGKHTFTGVYSDLESSTFARSYQRYAYTLDQNVYANNPASLNYPNYAAIHYLGGSLANRTSAAGANISGVTALHAPQKTGTALLFDARVNQWINAPVTVLGPDDNIDKLYSTSSRNLNQTESFSAIWQSFFFDNKLVGLVGWRQDEFSLYDAGPAPLVPVTGQVDPFSPTWKLPETPNIYAKDDTISWSAVLHAPEFIKKRLPADMDVSLSYNRSENFRPSSTIADVYGRPFDPPSGSTEDMGVTLSFAKNKFVLRVVKYETKQANDAATFYNTFWPGNDLVRAMNGLRGSTTNENVINRWFGFSPSDPRYLPVRASLSNPAQANNPNPTLTSAETAARNAWFAARTPAEWLRPVDPLLAQTWNLTQVTPGGNWSATRPPNVGNVADTVSEGWEFEATYNPLKNWRITFNAAMQEATKSNVGADFKEFVDANLPLWTDGDGIIATSIRAQEGFEDIPYFQSVTGSRFGVLAINNMYVPYLNALAAEGSAVQELRKWRFNFVTNYDFRNGFLKGFSVGGAARWQDRTAIGYGVKQNELGVWVYDVEKPFYGSDDLDLDVWLRYSRPIYRGKIRWTVQLNVRDFLGTDDLIAVSAQPNGQVASARIPQPKQWSLTNTFAF